VENGSDGLLTGGYCHEGGACFCDDFHEELLIDGGFGEVGESLGDEVLAEVEGNDELQKLVVGDFGFVFEDEFGDVLFFVLVEL